jgi:hypothetical protein
MNVPRSVQVEEYLLNHISNVRPSECGVLKNTCQAAEVSSIGRLKELPGGGGQLGIGVYRGGAGLAGSHACPIQDVQHVLSLIQEKSSD